MRLQRTSRLSDEELDELVEAVRAALDVPWHAPTGRPRALSLAEEVEATVIYLRHNLAQEVIADMYGVDQALISRTVAQLTPLLAAASAAHVPSLDRPATTSRAPPCCWTACSPRSGPGPTPRTALGQA